MTRVRRRDDTWVSGSIAPPRRTPSGDPGSKSGREAPTRSFGAYRTYKQAMTRCRGFEGWRRSLACPVVETGEDAGPSTRKLRVRAPPGVLKLIAEPVAGRPRGKGSSPVPHGRGRGSRPGRPPARRGDRDLRGGGVAVLASLMSSRSRVRIPPARSVHTCCEVANFARSTLL